MSVIGKTAIAPCGHTGEVIIGTYVKCSQGCEGPAIVPNRGEPGHVVNCACKPCQIRRKTAFIVLRDKGGKDWAKLEWDGVTDLLKSTSSKSGDLRHFKFLDADGKVIGAGSLDVFVDTGEFKVHPRRMIDALITCSVVTGAVEQEIITETNQVPLRFGSYIITYKGVPITGYP